MRLSLIIIVLLLAACMRAPQAPSDNSPAPPQDNSAAQDDCSVPAVRTVDGESMAPLINDSQNITALFNHYNCHEIARGDIILYNYSAKPHPIIKRVRAVPGDSWSLRVNTSDNTTAIIVNGEVLATAAGEPYRLSPGGARMLALYLHDYPLIPPDAYLLLGEDPHGTLDSMAFGLVAKQDILGKAVIKK